MSFECSSKAVYTPSPAVLPGFKYDGTRRHVSRYYGTDVSDGIFTISVLHYNA